MINCEQGNGRFQSRAGMKIGGIGLQWRAPGLKEQSMRNVGVLTLAPTPIPDVCRAAEDGAPCSAAAFMRGLCRATTKP